MYARVATWEGGSAEDIRSEMERLREDAGDGPPEGIPAKGFTMLADPDSGRVMAIVLFENNEDYGKGDETLSSMNPPNEGMGRRVSVDKYEVGVDLRL